MILIVDDDEGVIALLKKALEVEGYSVDTAEDGVQAYEYVKAHDCQCILLDLTMPRLNGMELLRLMLSDGIHVPTIIMAGLQSYEDEEMKQFNNVVTFLAKPFALHDMLNAVKQHATSTHQS